jgi:hypothetical protein
VAGRLPPSCPCKGGDADAGGAALASPASAVITSPAGSRLHDQAPLLQGSRSHDASYSQARITISVHN